MPPVKTVDVVHLYADEAGESRFGAAALDLAVTDFAPPAEPFAVSDPQAADRYVMIELPVGWGGDAPHPTPARHMLFCLAGEMEVTTSTGDTRRIAAGGALLMEDTTGKGHGTVVVSDVPVRAVMIRLA